MRAALMLLIGSLAYSAQSFCLTTSAPAGVPASVPSAVLATVSPFAAQAHWATQAVQLAKSRSSSRSSSSSSSRRSSRTSVAHTPSRTSSKNTRSSHCTPQPTEATRFAGGEGAGNKRSANAADRNDCTDSYGLDDQGNAAGGF